MTKANQDIRDRAKENNIPLWRIADKLCISECTFIRRLRKELNSEEKYQILTIITNLSSEE